VADCRQESDRDCSLLGRAAPRVLH
jgi:hypothetical protein